MKVDLAVMQQIKDAIEADLDAAYQSGLGEGEAEGYEKGFTDGQQAGYDEGFDAGQREVA